MTKYIVGLCLTVMCIAASAQKKYTAADIHSHNDYSRPNAFYHAFNAGVGFIEADVFLRKGKLMVAHDTTEIKPDRTLIKLYLQPLQAELQKHARPVTLLIDVKEGCKPILAELLKELFPLKSLLRSADKNQPLAILITGNRPAPIEYVNYPDYIFFDDDLQRPHDDKQWKRVKEISLNFANYSKWKGEGELPRTDEAVLRAVINAVHRAGKPVRFWGEPDNPVAWQKLIELGADILNTDKIDELKAYLAR